MVDVDERDRAGRDLTTVTEAWSAEVTRLYRELTLSLLVGPDAWGAYDLVAAYSTRDALAAMGAERGTLRHSLAAVDEWFKSFTVVVGMSWVGALGIQPGTGWWWSRVPRSGPVVEELHSMGAAVGLGPVEP